MQHLSSHSKIDANILLLHTEPQISVSSEMCRCTPAPASSMWRGTRVGVTPPHPPPLIITSPRRRSHPFADSEGLARSRLDRSSLQEDTHEWKEKHIHHGEAPCAVEAVHHDLPVQFDVFVLAEEM